MKSILLSILVLGVLGGLFGALLAYASKVFHVDVDPKQEQVRAKLPPTSVLLAAQRLPQKSLRSWAFPAPT